MYLARGCAAAIQSGFIGGVCVYVSVHLRVNEPSLFVFALNVCHSLLIHQFWFLALILVCLCISGDVKESGQAFWSSLLLMLVRDPSNLAALESIRVMFGAPQPHAENLKKRCV